MADVARRPYKLAELLGGQVAVIAGLTAAGMTSEAAVPAVFLYRIATCWLPILPGYIAYAAVLQRQQAL